MKESVTEIIYDFGPYSSPSPPENLKEYIAWLTGKLHSIPEEFRATAEVEIGATTSYDCASLEYVIKYTRPETEDEEKKRTDQENVRKEAIRRDELATLNRLKAKYDSLENA
jgi:hypothetical protein